MIPKFKISRVVLWTILALSAGLLLTAAMTLRQYEANRVQAQQALDSARDEIQREILREFGLFQYGLRAARGVVTTAGETGLTRKTFVAYSKTRDIKVEFPGARGFGFIRRVPRAEEARFLEQARRDDMPNFAIRELGPHDGDRYVIQYIEPREENSEAVGLDIASEANRREAADRAWRTGQTTLTGPITLVQSVEKGPQSFLLLLPVYRDLPAAERGESYDSLYGWTYTPLSISDVLDALTIDRTAVRLHLVDVTAADAEVVFYDTAPDAAAQYRTLSSVSALSLYGRAWRVGMHAGPAFIASLNQFKPLWVAGVGVSASLLFAAFVAVLSISRQRKHFAVAERARLATIVENSNDPIVGQALDGAILSWNRAAERQFGYTAAEVMGRPLADLLIAPDERAQDEDMRVRIGRGETVPPFDAVRLHRDGTRFEMSVTVGAIRDPSGRVIGLGKMLHDVGARKREERRLADSNARLEEEVSARTAELVRTNTLLADVLHAASEVSIIATDPEGLIQIFNSGAERMLGYSAEEIIGKHTPALLHVAQEVDARGAELTAQYGVPISGFRVFVHVPELTGAETREWTYRRKDGRPVRVSLVVTAMRDREGAVAGYLGIAQDITERRRHMAELEAARAAAESANRAKSQFLAMMSHELRTPMAGVLGMADLLLTSDLQNEQQRQVQTLKRSAQTLLGLLNDILDFAKIEANRIELEDADFSLKKVVEDVGAVIAPLASERGNNIRIDIEPNLSRAYRGDANRYRQVLMNLVSNANKFTADGEVVITVRQRVASLAGFVIETSVADTGIGIASENRERLFDPFVQESAAVSGKFGGTGLGLAICKRLVELMGGEITLESKLGVGSTFTFTVILNEGAVDKTEEVADAARRGASGAYVLPSAARPLHVLAAEDNDTNRMLLTTLLARMGHTVDAVEDGAQAVAALDQKSYDIILMDMQMPVMDGVAATQAIRAAGNRIPIIALTADGLPENHSRYLASGIDSIMTKPIDWAVLADEMDKLTSANRRMRDGAADVLQSAAHSLDADLLVDPRLLSLLVDTVGRDLVVNLLASLRSTVGMHMDEMARAVEAGDDNTAARAAHGVKGVVSQFGAVRLTNAARMAEVDARAGSLTAARVAEMRAIVAATLAALADALDVDRVI